MHLPSLQTIYSVIAGIAILIVVLLVEVAFIYHLARVLFRGP